MRPASRSMPRRVAVFFVPGETADLISDSVSQSAVWSNWLAAASPRKSRFSAVLTRLLQWDRSRHVLCKDHVKKVREG